MAGDSNHPRKRRAEGLTPLVLGDALEGEAREVGIVMAARSVKAHGQPIAAAALLLSGGETTVSIRGYLDRPPVSRARRHGSKICSLTFSSVKTFLRRTLCMPPVKGLTYAADGSSSPVNDLSTITA